MNENQDKGTAISVYGQEGLDDFPVLKAFQQYIDAEQSKARKRMVVLCVFFGFLMTVVIGVFVMMLRDKDATNQSLNDRLVEYVMKERERDATAKLEAQRPKDDPALRAMAESIASLQRQMSDQQVRLADQQAKFTDQQNKLAEQQRGMVERQEKAAAAATAAAKQAAEAAQAARTQDKGPSKEQLALQRQIDEDTAKLVKVRAILKAEREKLEAEKQRLHQEEVERQRRKLYPEYYANKDKTLDKDKDVDRDKDLDEDVGKAPKPQAKADKPISYFSAYKDDKDVKPDNDDLDDIDEVVAPVVESQRKEEAPKAKPQPPAAKPKPAAKPQVEPAAKPPVKPAAKPAANPIEKPKAEPSDHIKVPVEINGAGSDWLIPTA